MLLLLLLLLPLLMMLLPLLMLLLPPRGSEKDVLHILHTPFVRFFCLRHSAG